MEDSHAMEQLNRSYWDCSCLLSAHILQLESPHATTRESLQKIPYDAMKILCAKTKAQIIHINKNIFKILIGPA